MAMYCHGRRMYEADDYLNRCPHCGRERFAWRRAVNDLLRGGLAGRYDMMVDRHTFAQQGGKKPNDMFYNLWAMAWDRWHSGKMLYNNHTKRNDLVATDNQSQVEPLKSAQSDPKRKANT